MLIVQWIICIRLYIACLLRCICNLRKIRCIVRVRLLNGIPHFKKHDCKTPYSISFHPHTGIFPKAIRMGNIEIFIRQIVAAGKTNLSINDRNLSVIPVIHKHIDERHNLIENSTLNTLAFHLFDKIRIDKAHTANIIINQTDFHTFLCLLKENTFHARKGLRILNGMVFHKNKFLRLLQCFLLSFKAINRFRIKFQIRVVIHRISRRMTDIMRHISCLPVLIRQFLQNIFFIRQ